MSNAKSARRKFYLTVLDALDRAGVPYLLGGAFALRHYTGIERDTKDLDLFMRRDDVPPAFEAVRSLPFETKIEADHWLGKIMRGDGLVDLIYSSGNGLCGVDEEWYKYADRGDFLGRQVNIIPAEEMLWSKSFVQDRGRYDGADVAHLLLARADGMDWDRVLRRFDDHWPVLLSQLILFAYVFPSERRRVPDGTWEELTGRLILSLQKPGALKLTRGPFFSFMDYLSDLEKGYLDARLAPHGPLTGRQVLAWTRRLEEQIPGGHPMARKYSRRASQEVRTEMRHFKRKKHGARVKSRRQAIAIGLSKARRKGARVPSKGR